MIHTNSLTFVHIFPLKAFRRSRIEKVSKCLKWPRIYTLQCWNQDVWDARILFFLKKYNETNRIFFKFNWFFTKSNWKIAQANIIIAEKSVAKINVQNISDVTSKKLKKKSILLDSKNFKSYSLDDSLFSHHMKLYQSFNEIFTIFIVFRCIDFLNELLKHFVKCLMVQIWHNKLYDKYWMRKCISRSPNSIVKKWCSVSKQSVSIPWHTMNNQKFK